LINACALSNQPLIVVADWFAVWMVLIDCPMESFSEVRSSARWFNPLAAK
jgi:hypothetical protein